MENLSRKLEERFHLLPFEEFCARHPEEDYWNTFLIQSDYVANKIAEAVYMGTTHELEDYTQVVEARALCRRKINELRGK